MTSKLYNWDVRNIAKISPQMAKKRSLLILQYSLETLRTVRTKISTVIFHYIRVLYVQ